MKFKRFLRRYWFQLIQTVGIIATLSYTAIATNRNSKAVKVSTLLEVTQSHREIWQSMLTNPELFRVMEQSPDLEAEPITNEERLVVVLLVMHLNAAFEASQNGMITNLEGLQKDVIAFFALPIPRAVWTDLKQYQNAEFVQYIEGQFINQLYRP